MTNLLTNNWSSSFANLWILFCCPDKETTDVGSSTPGVVVHWLIVNSVGKASTASIRQLDRYIVSGCAALSTSVPICRELRNHGDFLAPPAFSFSTSNEIGVFVVLKTWGTLCLLTWGRRERKSLSSLRQEHFSSETASRLKVCRDDGIGEDDIV